MTPHTTAANVAGDEEMVEACTLRHRHNAAKNGGDDEVNGDRATQLAEEEAAAVERAFADKAMPMWQEQLTVHAFVVSFFLSIMFNVIIVKLNLTTGIIPSLNVYVGLLSFFFVRLWTTAIERIGLLRHPFTRQENAVIQTCVVATYSIAFSYKLFNSSSC